MIKTEKKMVEVDAITNVLCNKCGGTCLLHSYDPKKLNVNCVVGEIEGGFESTHIPDMVRYKFHLCESCVAELMKTFVIPADAFDLNINMHFPEETDEDIPS